MGTNYYHVAETFDNVPDRIHIGKSSGGWCFALHVDAEQNINGLDDWKNKFMAANSHIVNEYGDTVSVDEMLDIILNRKWKPHVVTPEFLDRNYAVLGPNNLLRSRVGDYCFGHGDGTYDLIPGEFC